MTSSLSSSPASPSPLFLRLQSSQSQLRSYFSSGITRPYSYRISQLQSLLRLITENDDEICKALHADLGKPRQEANFAEIVTVKSEISNVIDHLSEWMKPTSVPTPIVLLPASSHIAYEPYGCVLIISPFNYPVQLMIMPMVSAIAAGNVCCIKPSELTPETEKLMGKLLSKYLNPNSFLYIPGEVVETTALLQLRWDYIFFTGSEMVGKIVQRAAAEYLTPTTLELGGKSPTIVTEDADISLSSKRIIWGKCLNSGQTCIAPDYVFVHKKVKSQFINKCKETLKEFYGDNIKGSKDYGRIVSKRHTERLAKLIESDQKSIVVGGEVDKETKYISPTLMECKVNDNSKSMEEEIFGPILPILEYENLNEVIQYINAKPKPLALYAFTTDSKKEQFIVNNTSSGGVSINDTIMHIANHNLPFGGVGSSGIGAYHGHIGFKTFSHQKSVLVKSLYGDAPARYPPYSNGKIKLLGFLGTITKVDSAFFSKWFKILIVPIVLAAIAHRMGIKVVMQK